MRSDTLMNQKCFSKRALPVLMSMKECWQSISGQRSKKEATRGQSTNARATQAKTIAKRFGARFMSAPSCPNRPTALYLRKRVRATHSDSAPGARLAPRTH